MSNPNGLTDEQIAARPRPFVGMLVYAEDSDGFGAFSHLPSVNRGDEKYYLLPGEEGCPWPPPEEYRHDWKPGDRAWLYEPRPMFEGEEHWKCVEVYRHMGKLVFDDMEGRCEMPYSIDTTAIYIPEEEQAMSNIAYTEYGDVDVGRMAKAMGADAATLAAMLRAVWLDAYALGWSDGKKDADPDVRQNPYEYIPEEDGK